MAGFRNSGTIDVIYGDNVDFSGAAIPSPSITANGQLLVGSTVAPNIRTGTITSPSGTITIGYSSPNITIDLAGGSIGIDSISPNSGTDPVFPDGAGKVTLIGSGSITSVGSSNTVTWSLTGLTNHAVLVGAGTATITKVGPTATSGQIFQSGGSSADPVFSTATYPSVATGTGTILRADGTNWVATTATYPATTTVSQILYSSSNNVIGGITAGIDGVLISDHATGAPSWLANGTVDYVLSANTNAPPSWKSVSDIGSITSIVTDMGTAIPTAGTLNVLGSHGLNTTGATDTVTVQIDNSITLGDLSPLTAADALTASTGDISLGHGNVNLTYGAAFGFSGYININANRAFYALSDNWLAVGINAGNFNSSGTNSTFVGGGSGASVISGSGNTTLGYNSLSSASSPSFCTVVGESAMSGSVNSQNTVVIGASALQGISGGTGNIIIGTGAGGNYANTESNNILIGNLGVLSESGAIRLGTDGTHNSFYTSGVSGVTVSNTSYVTIDTTTGQLGSTAIPSIFSWIDQNVDTIVSSNTGYFAIEGVTLTLPPSPLRGDTIIIVSNTPSTVIIQANTSQFIRIGRNISISAGTVTNSSIGDSLTLVFDSTNTVWISTATNGNWDLA